MKVLKITPWYPSEVNPLLGSFVEDQAHALIKDGIDVGVLYVDMDFRNIFKKIKSHHFKSTFKNENGIKIFRYNGFFPPKISLRIHKKWSSYFEVLFKQYVEKYGKPSILHAHTFHAAYATSFLSEKYNIPFVITEHSTALLTTGVQGWRKQILTDSFNKASKIISVSQGLKNALLEYSTSEIIVIPNLIDIELFSIKNAKSNQKIKLIAVGDLIPRKGFDYLIKSFSQIDSSLKEKLHLSIIGGGNENVNLQKLITSLNENDRIFLTGELPRSEVAKKMKESDIFILSSLKETFGIVIIEAMATGLPVLATRCVGSESIIPNYAGIFVQPKNLDSMTKGIAELCKSYPNYLPNQIRKYVLDNFSEQVVARRLIQVYQSILKS